MSFGSASTQNKRPAKAARVRWGQRASDEGPTDCRKPWGLPTPSSAQHLCPQSEWGDGGEWAGTGRVCAKPVPERCVVVFPLR